MVRHLIKGRETGGAAFRRKRAAPPPACGRLYLLRPVAVGVGDYFHQVTVGVVEIDAATAVQMIDLAGIKTVSRPGVAVAARCYHPLPAARG